MTCLLEVLHRDVLTEIFQWLHCQDMCQLDRAVTSRLTRPYLHDAFQYTNIQQYQISSNNVCLSSCSNTFAEVFFPESLISLNILGNLRHGWDTLQVKKSQVNALQWIVDRKFKLKLILFDFCTEFNDKTFLLLSHIPSIEIVDCKNCHISNDELLALFQYLPRIKRLSFQTRVSPSFVATLSHSCSTLHTLFLTFGYGSEIKCIGVIISNCHSLVVLHIRKMHTAVLPIGNELICGKSTSLQHFNCEIDGGVQELITLGIPVNFSSLKTLVLTVPNKQITDEYIRQLTLQLKNIQWFGLRYAKISQRAVSCLLTQYPFLKRLDLYCCRMNGNPFAQLPVTRGTTSPQLLLEHLEFVWNNYEYPGYIYASHRAPFTADELCHIISMCPHLRHLKCTDPGPHNIAFRASVNICATASDRQEPLEIKYIRY